MTDGVLLWVTGGWAYDSQTDMHQSLKGSTHMHIHIL